GRADHLVCELRAHLRPVRRRHHTPRLDPGAYGRASERDLPATRPRLRDRRRRRLHLRTARPSARAAAPGRPPSVEALAPGAAAVPRPVSAGGHRPQPRPRAVVEPRAALRVAPLAYRSLTRS